MPTILEQTALLQEGASRDDVLLTLFGNFETELGSAPEAIEALTAMKEAALEREHTSSTYLGRGLAVPHGRSNQINTIRIAVGISESGIAWGEDGEKAHLVLLLGVPAVMIRDYLLLMQKILRWHKDTKTLDADGRVLDSAALLAELKAII